MKRLTILMLSGVFFVAGPVATAPAQDNDREEQQEEKDDKDFPWGLLGLLGLAGLAGRKKHDDHQHVQHVQTPPPSQGTPPSGAPRV